MGIAAEKIEDHYQAACSHCGSVTAPEVIPDVDDNHAVICNTHQGGCGASGGYARTPREAIVKWNRRT